MKGNDRADRLAGKAALTSGLLLGRSDDVEELETLPAGTKPRTSRTPSIAWRREAWKEETLDDLP